MPERRGGGAHAPREIVAACRAATTLPLYAKLSPANWDIAEVARAVADAGADGLSLVNTIRGLKLDERTLRPTLGPAPEGYSGPALKPIALAAVYACSARRRPADRRDGRDRARAATRSSSLPPEQTTWRSGRCSSPTRDAPARIRDELAAEVAALGHSDVDELQGIAHAGSDPQPGVETSRA